MYKTCGLGPVCTKRKKSPISFFFFQLWKLFIFFAFKQKTESIFKEITYLEVNFSDERIRSSDNWVHDIYSKLNRRKRYRQKNYSLYNVLIMSVKFLY